MPALALLPFPPVDEDADLEARLLWGGAAALDDLEALQLLGGLAPGLAEALVDEFGSLPEVLAADAAALGRIVPAAAAARVALLADLARRQLAAPLRARAVLSSWTAVCDYLRASLAGRTREEFRVLFLDKRNRLIRVHVSLRAFGDSGERLSPKKADLERWRQGFARALREHGIEAEATPRRARGVTLKAERSPLRKLRERAERGRAQPGRVHRAALVEAARRAFGNADEERPWETATSRQQARVRAIYLAQARLLQLSSSPEDRNLATAVETFVRSMPAPDTQSLLLARQLREANRQLGGAQQARPGKDRS